MMLGTSPDLDCETLDLFPTGSLPAGPARGTARRARDLAWTIHAQDYGRKSPAWLARFDPVGSCWRTAQTCLGSTGDVTLAEFSETWPRSGTMRSGTAYRLPPLTHPTSVIASGSSNSGRRCTGCQIRTIRGARGRAATSWGARSTFPSTRPPSVGCGSWGSQSEGKQGGADHSGHSTQRARALPDIDGFAPVGSAIARQEHVSWLPEPDVVRVVHGCADRVERIRALGNLNPPIIVEQLGRAILETMA